MSRGGVRGKKRLQRRRAEMWREDPHCRRCGTVTFLPESVPNLKALQKAGKARHLATIDHLVTRYDHEVRRNPTPGERRWRLLCYGCNGDLARERELLVPLEERQRRARAFPRTGT